MAEQDESEHEACEDDKGSNRDGERAYDRGEGPAENRGGGTFDGDYERKDGGAWGYKPSIEPPDKWR